MRERFAGWFSWSMRCPSTAQSWEHGTIRCARRVHVGDPPHRNGRFSWIYGLWDLKVAESPGSQQGQDDA